MYVEVIESQMSDVFETQCIKLCTAVHTGPQFDSYKTTAGLSIWLFIIARLTAESVER